MRRLAVVVALVLLVASCTATRTGDPPEETTSPTEPTEPTEQPGRRFTIEDTDIRVAPGDSFTVAVDDNASVGDMWSVSAEPDAEVVESRGDHYEPESDEDVVGGGGTRFFEFQALREGATSVELRNCFRGCREPDDDHRYEIAIEVG